MASRTVDLQYRYVLDLVDKATRPWLKATRDQQSAVKATEKAMKAGSDTAEKAAQAEVRAQAKAAASAKAAARSIQAGAEVSKRAGDTVAGAAAKSQHAASTVIAASRRTAGSYDQVGREAEAAGRAQTRAADRAVAAAKRMATATKDTAKAGASGLRSAAPTGAVVAVAGAAGFGGAAALAAGVSYEKQMDRVRAVAGATQAQMKQMDAQALQLGADTQFSAKDAADGMYQLSTAGFTANQTMKIIPGTLSLAAASGVDLASAAELQANALRGFGLQGKDASMVADVLAKTVNSSAIEMSDLAETLPYVSSTAKQTGTSFKEVAAMAGLLGNAGIKGSMAGTALRTSMLRLTDPTKKMSGVFNELGLKQKDLAAIPLPEVIGKIAGSLNKLPTRGEKVGAISAIFGKEAAPSMLNLMSKGEKGIDRLVGQLDRSRGAAKKTADVMRDNVAGAWDQFTGSVETSSITLEKRFAPQLKNALNNGATLVNRGSATLSGFVTGITTKVKPPPRVDSRALGQAGDRSAAAPKDNSISFAEKAGQRARVAVQSVGRVAISAGRQLLDAFKPAKPFLQNVLLPLLIGVGKGVLGSVVGAFKILVPTVKVVATVLGFLGEKAKPLKPVFEGVGVAIGFLAGPSVLGLLGKLPKVGKVFELLAIPVKATMAIFGAAARVIGAFGLRVITAFAKVNPAVVGVRLVIAKVPGFIAAVIGKSLAAARAVANGILKGIDYVKAAPGRVAGYIGKLGDRLGGLAGAVKDKALGIGKAIVDGIVSGIKSAPGAIANAVSSVVPGPLKGALSKIPGLPFRRGGRVPRFQDGGLVPAYVSPGEDVHYGDSIWRVPGARTNADSVFTALPAGAAVLTADGQDRLAAGMSMASAVATQAPHFRTGGLVGNRVSGKASTFGPPLEKAGTTALGVSSGTQGVAIRPGATFGTGRPYLGGYWRVSVGGHTGILRQTDLGPHEDTGRRIDVTGAGAIKLGINPRTFPTDSTATATFLGTRGSTAALKRKRKDGEGSPAKKATFGAYGDRAQNAIGEGFAQGLAGARRIGGSLLSQISASSVREKDKGGGPSAATASAGTQVAGGTPSTAYGRMIAKANQITRAKYQYAWGGGHARIGVPGRGSLHANNVGPVGLGYDCSGSVSAVLGAGGLLKMPLTSGALMNWGKPGGGKRLGVMADQAHVIMRLGGRYFGTSGSNPKGGAGWIASNTMAGRGVTRTAAGFRKGGYVLGSNSSTTGGLTGPLNHDASRVLSASSTTSVTTPMRRLASALADVEVVSFKRLDEIAQSIRGVLSKLRKQGRSKSLLATRERALLDLVRGEQGRRLGQAALAGDDRAGRATASAQRLEYEQRTRGTTGSDALAGQAAQQAGARMDLTAAAARYAQVIASYRKRSKTVPTELTDRLKDVQDQIRENAMSYAETLRDFVRARAQERVDAVQNTLDVGNANGAFADAVARVNGTAGTPADLRAQAQRLLGSVPQLDQLRQADLQQAQAAQTTGDVAGFRSAMLAATQAATDMASAQADAADLVRQAARDQAQAGVDTAGFGGDVAAAGLAALENQERLAGVYDSASAGLERASFIRDRIVPALQAEVDAARASVQSAAETDGVNSAAWRAAVLDLLGKSNDLTSANVQANEETASNTEKIMDNTGSLTLEYRGSSTTDDLIGFGAGA